MRRRSRPPCWASSSPPRCGGRTSTGSSTSPRPGSPRRQARNAPCSRATSTPTSICRWSRGSSSSRSGMKTTLAHVDDPLEIIPAIGLCGGLALYMAAHVAMRLRIGGGWGHGRPTADRRAARCCSRSRRWCRRSPRSRWSRRSARRLIAYEAHPLSVRALVDPEPSRCVHDGGSLEDRRPGRPAPGRSRLGPSQAKERPHARRAEDRALGGTEGRSGLLGTDHDRFCRPVIFAAPSDRAATGGKDVPDPLRLVAPRQGDREGLVRCPDRHRDLIVRGPIAGRGGGRSPRAGRIGGRQAAGSAVRSCAPATSWLARARTAAPGG